MHAEFSLLREQMLHRHRHVLDISSFYIIVCVVYYYNVSYASLAISCILTSINGLTQYRQSSSIILISIISNCHVQRKERGICKWCTQDSARVAVDVCKSYYTLPAIDILNM